MNVKGNHFINVSLNEETLKIVEVRGSGVAARVVNLAARDVRDISLEELPAFIQKAFVPFKTKTANLFFVISPTMLTTKNIEIPSVNADEIKSIVNLQASRHTPFTREEIQIGYINIGVYKKNYSKVLLIIANKNVLKEQLIAFQRAGVNFRDVLFPGEAVAAFYSRAIRTKPKGPPQAIIDIGQTSSEFVVMHKGVAITTRNIPIGKFQLNADGANAQRQLMEELSRTIEAYQAEDIEALPGSYVITADDGQTQSLLAAIKEKMGWDVKTVPYVDNIKVNKNALRAMATEYADISFLDLMAAAATAKDLRVSLNPEELQLQKTIEEQGREVFKAAVLTIGLMTMIGATLGLKVYYKSSFLNKLKSDNSTSRQSVEALEGLSKKTKAIEGFLESRMDSLDTIRELYQRIPDEVYLTSIEMDSEGNVSIQGISDVASIVFNLGTSLKESPFFQSVDIKSTTSRKDRGKDVSAFEITLKIKEGAVIPPAPAEGEQVVK